MKKILMVIAFISILLTGCDVPTPVEEAFLNEKYGGVQKYCVEGFSDTWIVGPVSNGAVYHIVLGDTTGNGHISGVVEYKKTFIFNVNTASYTNALMYPDEFTKGLADQGVKLAAVYTPNNSYMRVVLDVSGCVWFFDSNTKKSVLIYKPELVTTNPTVSVDIVTNKAHWSDDVVATNISTLQTNIQQRIGSKFSSMEEELNRKINEL